MMNLARQRRPVKINTLVRSACTAEVDAPLQKGVSYPAVVVERSVWQSQLGGPMLAVLLRRALPRLAAVAPTCELRWNILPRAPYRCRHLRLARAVADRLPTRHWLARQRMC